MPLFSLVVRCEGIGEVVTQRQGSSPYDAITSLLKTSFLRDMVTNHPDWPNDFSSNDVYLFTPLEGLPNAYFCGLGAKGKYVGVNIFQTVKRSAPSEKYCGPTKEMVTLR